jgi:hypothetical protein
MTQGTTAWKLRLPLDRPAAWFRMSRYSRQESQWEPALEPIWEHDLPSE